jgi:hypothetical protein
MTSPCTRPPQGGRITKLQRLHSEYGQSPWLDNLTRSYLRDGTLAQMVGDGIRGVTVACPGPRKTRTPDP